MTEVIYYTAERIPTVDPKDPDSDVWYGFEYTLETDETIGSSAWLINDSLVADGETVDGLTFVTSERSGSTCKARVTGGILGKRYKLTNRTSTNVTPSDDKSMYFFCKNT